MFHSLNFLNLLTLHLSNCHISLIDLHLYFCHESRSKVHIAYSLNVIPKKIWNNLIEFLQNLACNLFHFYHLALQGTSVYTCLFGMNSWNWAGNHFWKSVRFSRLKPICINIFRHWNITLFDEIFRERLKYFELSEATAASVKDSEYEKLAAVRSQLEASSVAGHTEELWYNETLCLYTTSCPHVWLNIADSLVY